MKDNIELRPTAFEVSWDLKPEEWPWVRRWVGGASLRLEARLIHKHLEGFPLFPVFVSDS